MYERIDVQRCVCGAFMRGGRCRKCGREYTQPGVFATFLAMIIVLGLAVLIGWAGYECEELNSPLAPEVTNDSTQTAP